MRPALFAISSLIMLLMANLYPFITMQAVGNSNTMLFIQAGTVLFDEHYQLLSLVVLACIQGIPAFCMLLVIYLSIATRFKKLPGKVFFCRLLFMLKPWCMVEIFLIAILVSFVKLVALAEISLDMSFWAFCLFCVLQIRAFQ
ncbi:MAG: paraquat-inducible protein A, partial [Plesiomonas shigelloides]